MNILIDIKNFLDKLFFPFLTCYGSKHKWLNKLLKVCVCILWTLSFCSLCALINQLDYNNEQIEEKKQSTQNFINFGMTFLLIISFLLLVLITINFYISIEFLNEDFWPNKIARFIFIILSLLYFIYYCKFMNEYYTTNIETEDPILLNNHEFVSLPEENTTKIYSGSLRWFFGFTLFIYCFLFACILFLFWPWARKVLLKFSHFSNLNIKYQENGTITGSYLPHEGCLII